MPRGVIGVRSISSGFEPDGRELVRRLEPPIAAGACASADKVGSACRRRLDGRPAAHSQAIEAAYREAGTATSNQPFGMACSSTRPS